MTATGTRVCVLIENAETFPPAVLRSLHELTAADVASSAGANVILTTQLPPDELLASSEIQSFAQRARLRSQIEVLSETETADYLEFKCAYGGVDAEQVFAPGLAGELHAYTGGILRVMDNLLESALVAAATDGGKVTLELIARVAGQQMGLSRVESSAIEAETVDRLLTDPTEIPTLTDFVDFDEAIDEGERVAVSISI